MFKTLLLGGVRRLKTWLQRLLRRKPKVPIVDHSFHIVLTPSGVVNSLYPDGNDGTTMTWANIPSSLGNVEGTPVTIPIRSYLTEPGSPNATLAWVGSVLPPGWVMGTDNLTYSGTGRGNVTGQISATRGTAVVYSNFFQVESIAGLAADTTAPTIPIGIAVTNNSSINTITFDPSCDVFVPGAVVSGLKDFRLYRDGGLIQTTSVSQGFLPTYTYGDIGTPGVSGNAAQSGVDWTVTGASMTNPYGVTLTSDSFGFLSTPLVGDAIVTTKITSYSCGNGLGGIGLMVRTDSSADSQFVNVAFRSGTTNSIAATVRNTKGGQAVSVGSVITPVSLPVYLKINRSSSTFNFYYSLDGKTWILVGAATIVGSPTAMLYGTFVYSNDNTITATASVNSLAVQNIASPGFIDSGLPPSTAHTYEVTARDIALNESPKSPAVSVTTPAFSFGVADSVLRTAGYILVTDAPYNAVPDGVTDSTAGIQAAIQAGIAQFKPVWFKIDPTGAGRPYIISDTLRCLYHFNTSAAGVDQVTLVGASVDPVTGAAARPKIKIAANAPHFSNATNYYPMICIRTLSAQNSGVPWPGDFAFDILTTPAGWAEFTGNCGFGGGIFGIDLDTNQNPGAAGWQYLGAQACHVQDMTITATGSFSGTTAIMVEGSGVVNMKIIGGQYGIWGGRVRGSYTDTSGHGNGDTGFAEGHITGLTCIGQTVACVSFGGFMSDTLCGFDLQPALGATAFAFNTFGFGNFGGMVLVDGKITMASSADTAIINNGSSVANMNIHNVYVTGTTHIMNIGGGVGIINSGGLPTDWNLINDYHLSTNLTGVVNGTTAVPTNSIIYSGGSNNPAQASLHAQTPLNHYQNFTFNSAAAPSDILTRHIFTMPQIDNGSYIDITKPPYNCVPATYAALNDLRNKGALNDATAPDCRAGLQAAIDAAEAGNGRVFLPRGSWCIGSPGIVLKSKTILFGTSQSKSQIIPQFNWIPLSGNPPVIDTVDNTEATTQLVNLMVVMPQVRGTTVSYTSRSGFTNTVLSGNRFNMVNWRVGRKSIFSNIYLWVPYQANGYASFPKQQLFITGPGGGGRFYSYAGGYNDATNQDTDFYLILISGTTQPIWIYACNVEMGGKGGSTGPFPVSNILIQNSSNIRIFQTKREGASPTVLITNGHNIGYYSGGKLGRKYNATVPAHFYPDSIYAESSIDTASTNLMFASRTVFWPDTTAANQKLVYDQASGLSVNTQTSICLYLKGQIDDSVMGH